MRAGVPVAEDKAQATVEMAVVLPVLLILAILVYNVMLFACAVARFDHVVADVVMAQAVSPPGDSGATDGAARVAASLEEAMEGYRVLISVAGERGASTDGGVLELVGALHTYRCEMRFQPWPGALSIAGVSLGAPLELTHTRSITVDPWRPGVVA